MTVAKRQPSLNQALAALKDLLGDAPDMLTVHGVRRCRHCYREYPLNDAPKDATECSDDCPGYLARRVLAQAKSSRKAKPKMTIDPPGEEYDGTDPSFRVVYQIDVNAANPLEAARQVHQIMTDTRSMKPCFTIIDHRGKQTTVDLEQEEVPE
jgi:hypothetical protein